MKKLFYTDEELKELSFKELWRLLDLYLILRFTPILTYLTRYPPFSFFWQDRFFHYENWDIRFSREKIEEVLFRFGYGIKIIYIDRDQYFLTLSGKFVRLGKKRDIQKNFQEITKRLEEKDMYFKELKKGFYEIKVKNSTIKLES